jgi:hypothetical protein
VESRIFTCNVLQDRSLFLEAIDGVDLVVAATDSEASKNLINRICWQQGIPVLYGAAYDRAFGGEVFRGVPPDGACYACLQASMSDFFDNAPRTSEIDYASIEDPTRFMAEPGLGIDVGFIGMLLAKMALLTLLRGTKSRLEDYTADYVMWGNSAVWAFSQPLQALFIEVNRQPGCEVCDPAGYAAAHLPGLSAEDIDRRADQLLASARRAAEPGEPMGDGQDDSNPANLKRSERA